MAIKEEKMSSIAIDLIPSCEREAAAARWQHLEQATANSGLTNSWRWTEAWLRQFSDVPHTFAFGVRDGESIGAALVTQPVQRWKNFLPFRALYMVSFC